MPRIKLKFDKVLLLIILFGLGLRLTGIMHGFPFIFHPDEPAVVRSATGIRFDPNPGHFDWPHMHFYLNFILHWLFTKFRGGLNFLGLKDSLSSIFPLLWRDPLVFYFLSRVLNAFLGALTAIPVYLAGKKLFSRQAGLYAALTLMLMPFHIHTSAFALIDIPTAFWVAWAFYFSTCIFRGYALKNYLWAGLFVGFAASTKYNGGLMAVMVPIAHILRTWKSKIEKVFEFSAIKALFLSGVLALFGFLAGTPFAAFDYDTFSRTDGPKGAFWQFENVGKTDLVSQGIQFVEVLTFEFAENFGYTPILLYTLTLLFALFVQREKRVWMVFLPSLFLIFYISGFSKARAHYFLSAYPFVALVAGYTTSRLLTLVKGYKRYLLLPLIFISPLWLGLVRVSELYNPDSRVLAYNWLETRVSESDDLYYNTTDFTQVMEKFSKNHRVHGLKDIEGAGYLIVGLDEDEIVEFRRGSHADSFVEDDYEKRVEFSSEGRKGPTIFIYEF